MNRLLLLSLFLCISIIKASEVDTTEKQPLKLINADENINRFTDGVLITEFFGNVVFELGDITIKNDTTRWYEGEGRLTLNSNVIIERPAYTLSCRKAEILSDDRIMILTDSVVGVDSLRELTVSADTTHYYMNNDSVELQGNPSLLFWSSESEDSLLIESVLMRYNNVSGYAEAIDSVTMSGSELQGRADTAIFWAVGDSSAFIGNPQIALDESGVRGDTILLYFSNESIDSFDLKGEKPLAFLKDSTGFETMHLLGDRLGFSVNGNALEAITASDNARAIEFRKSDTTEIMTLAADTLFFTFEKGDLAEVHSSSEGTCHRLEEDSEMSLVGDSLAFHFDDNKLSFIDAIGNAESKSFSDSSRVNSIRSALIRYESNENESFLKASGSVRSVYYSDTTSVNEIAGDSLEIEFSEGVVQSVNVIGGVFGVIKSLESDTPVKESGDAEERK